MEGPRFIKNKFKLHTSPEVENAAERTYKISGEKISQKPAEQIQNYLDHFKEIIETRNIKKDIAAIIGCSEDKIDVSGIHIFSLTFLLDGLTTAEGLVLPEGFGCVNLHLNGLTTAEKQEVRKKYQD